MKKFEKALFVFQSKSSLKLKNLIYLSLNKIIVNADIN